LERWPDFRVRAEKRFGRRRTGPCWCTSESEPRPEDESENIDWFLETVFVFHKM
jgi:hypothetical protein